MSGYASVFCFGNWCPSIIWSCRPFRRLDGNGDLRWEKIKSFDKGHIYKQVCDTITTGWPFCLSYFFTFSSGPFPSVCNWSVLLQDLTCCVPCFLTPVLCGFLLFQGNLFDFLRLTGWRGSKVLYFGDHLYSDLAVSVTTWWRHHWWFTLWLCI